MGRRKVKISQFNVSPDGILPEILTRRPLETRARAVRRAVAVHFPGIEIVESINSF